MSCSCHRLTLEGVCVRVFVCASAHACSSHLKRPLSLCACVVPYTLYRLISCFLPRVCVCGVVFKRAHTHIHTACNSRYVYAVTHTSVCVCACSGTSCCCCGCRIPLLLSRLCIPLVLMIEVEEIFATFGFETLPVSVYGYVGVRNSVIVLPCSCP